MNIVVCIKQVPDSAAKVTAEGGQVTWGDAPLVLNPWDEYAVETALTQQEALGGDVTAAELKHGSDYVKLALTHLKALVVDVIVVSVGGESAKDALKTALAMGCNQAILISDAALAGADSRATAHVLAAAINKLEDVGLAFFGRQAIDGDMGVTAAQTGRVLGWPVLSAVSSLSINGAVLSVVRTTEEGKQMVDAKFPAVVSVSKDIGEPRYPSFMGIRKAARANIPEWSMADLGIEAPVSVVRWPDIANTPVREVTTEMITGDSPQEIAEKLADKILAEKVL